MLINKAMREWSIDQIKRTGSYKVTLGSLFRGEIDYDSKLNFIEKSDSISRNDIELKQSIKTPFLWRRASSSGTSGRPLLFPQPLTALQSEQAFIDFLWFKSGYYPKARVAVMRGMGGFKGTCRFLNRIIVSADGWEDHDIREKYFALKIYQPEFIDCYPSILERFIIRCIGLGLHEFSQAKGILAGSEACTPQQEDIFKKYLGANTVSWYGQSEQVALGLKVEDDVHHLLPQYSDLAFIRHDETLEITGRSKLNPFFSANWYRTGDYCSSVEVGYNTDLKLPVLIVKGLRGRNPEFIRTLDGNLVPFNQIVFGLHGDFWLTVTRYCFVQEEPGIIKFYYTENTGMSANELIDKLRARLPHNTELISICDPKLEKVLSNKWRYFWPSRPSFLDEI